MAKKQSASRSRQTRSKQSEGGRMEQGTAASRRGSKGSERMGERSQRGERSQKK